MMQRYNGHYYRSADDRLNLYARDYNENSGGIPILMMHGLTRNSADFENIADVLRHKHRLIVPDQRGRGRSDYDPDPDNYTPQVYAQDMFALLQSLGIEQVIFMGTSMGGLIAMLMIASKADIARALILNDIGPEVATDGLARLQGYVGKPVKIANWDDAAEHCRKTNEQSFPDYGDDDWMAFAHRTCITDENDIPKLAYDMAISQGVQGDKPTAAPPDLWPVWDMMSQIPALAIRGQESDILLPTTLQKMKAGHSGYFSAIEIPGRGHAPMLDELAAVEAIGSFLDAILSNKI
ncbi:MAG: alpha/beta hydrolase [Parasphingorhabdus sp.]|uniref:alpha/beta fold hydrolase n=1 Tax=Parasphingorhabdus sp. TaxID=2709688 RepID=UPI003266E955